MYFEVRYPHHVREIPSKINELNRKDLVSKINIRFLYKDI